METTTAGHRCPACLELADHVLTMWDHPGGDNLEQVWICRGDVPHRTCYGTGRIRLSFAVDAP
jgi:hypothetical protein